MAESVYTTSTSGRTGLRQGLRLLVPAGGALLLFLGVCAVMMPALLSAGPYPWDPESPLLAIIGEPLFGVFGLGVAVIGAALVAGAFPRPPAR